MQGCQWIEAVTPSQETYGRLFLSCVDRMDVLGHLSMYHHTHHCPILPLNKAKKSVLVIGVSYSVMPAQPLM